MFFGRNQVHFQQPWLFCFVLFLIGVSLPAQQPLELLGPPDAHLVVGSFALWRKRGQHEKSLSLSVKAKTHSTKCQPKTGSVIKAALLERFAQLEGEVNSNKEN